LRRKKSKEDNKDKKFDDYSNIDYSHQVAYETSPRPMQYTAEIPDMNDHDSVPPVYYGSKPEEDINAYNKENFLKSPHHNDATTNSTSNIKPDEVDEDQFQKPNRYEP
jgi:hypothetical protein